MTNLMQPLYICIIMAFFLPFTLISSICYMLILISIFVCVLGLLFWRAGLQITLPLSVTSTSWLDMRTVISSASFSRSGPLQFPWCIRFGTGPTLDNHSWADEQTFSLMPYAATARLLASSGIPNQTSCSSTAASDFCKSSKQSPELQAIVLCVKYLVF